MPIPAIALALKTKLRTIKVTTGRDVGLKSPDGLPEDLSNDLSGVGEFVTTTVQAPCSLVLFFLSLRAYSRINKL